MSAVKNRCSIEGCNGVVSCTFSGLCKDCNSWRYRWTGEKKTPSQVKRYVFKTYRTTARVNSYDEIKALGRVNRRKVEVA